MPRKQRSYRKQIALLCRWLAWANSGMVSQVSMSFRPPRVMITIIQSPISVDIKLVLSDDPLPDIRNLIGIEFDHWLDVVIAKSNVTFIRDCKRAFQYTRHDGLCKLIMALGRVLKSCRLYESIQDNKEIPQIFSGIIRVLQERYREPDVVISVAELLAEEIHEAARSIGQ